jgi:hypothetical protein
VSLSDFPNVRPDPENPLQPFEDGEFWFSIAWYPARLATKPISYFATRGGLGGNIAMVLWEEVGGAIARRLDARYKVLVRRKKAGLIGGYRVVSIELVESEDAARDRCEELVQNWAANRTRYMQAAPMSRRAVRAKIRSNFASDTDDGVIER